MADPDAMVTLYDEAAILHGTTSPVLRQGPEAIREYFAGAAEVPGLKMQFTESHIRIYGDTAVNTGFYSVSFPEEGKLRTIPLRYSFVYRKRGNKWMIVDHHSSLIPE